MTDPELTSSQGDVASRPDVARVFDEALLRLGRLDVLVNNAGIAGPTGAVEEIYPGTGTAVWGCASRGSSTAPAWPYRICGRARDSSLGMRAPAVRPRASPLVGGGSLVI
jgi:hypothetical protein